MKMGDVDWTETEKRVKAANNKSKKKAATVKQKAKQQTQEADQKERKEQARMFVAEVDIDNNLLDGEDDDFVIFPQFSKVKLTGLLTLCWIRRLTRWLTLL